MHLAPKQILINAHVNFRNELARTTSSSVNEVEELIKRAEPKVDKIFLETARESEPGTERADPAAHRISYKPWHER